MISKDIVYFGGAFVLFCDEKCNKAWGINQRPSHQLSDNEDDYEWLTDEELGEAPDDPGTYEGGCAKPTVEETESVFKNPNANRDKLNKWCCRECERSKMIDMGKTLNMEDDDYIPLLQDFSKRVKNING